MLKTTEEKVRLPLLATGKPHISYSEFSDWYSCQRRHKLKYIDKIHLDSISIHTIFGQVIHNALEERINFKKELISEINEPEFWRKEFIKEYNEFYAERFKPELLKDNALLAEEQVKTDELFKNFIPTFENILETVIEWLDTTFPDGWEPVDAEVEIYQPIMGKDIEGYFKGFIDLVIKVPKYNKNKTKVSYVYWILDWKTTEWGWRKADKSSFKKQAQLLSYKQFYSTIKNIPISDIKCGWILVKRKPKKGELPYELVTVPSSEAKIKEANDKLRTMLLAMEKKMFYKNFSECLYCVYRPTDHCSYTVK